MNETKWTSGPWEICKANNYEGFSIAPKGILPTLASVERCGSNIAVNCFNFPGETKANAHLIAAAPELDESHESLIDAIKTLIAGRPVPDMIERLSHAMSVRAKARGEQL